MGLGKLLTDWVAIYNPSDVRVNQPKHVQEAITALSMCTAAAFQYFQRAPGAVYKAMDGRGLDAEYLIGCDKDLMGVTPPGCKWKAFKKSTGLLGYVLESPNNVLKLYDPITQDTKVQRGGLWYEDVGDHQGKTIYARLDKGAIKALQSGKNLTDAQLGIYEKALQKGVIPSGSTGSDGIKFDNATWVVKITISIASANQMDNTLSPAADEVRDDSKNGIFLNFNKLVLRH